MPAERQTAEPAPNLLEADWPAVCRRIVEAQRAVFAEHAGIDARTEYAGRGEGGDWALVIDRHCEDAAFVELDALAGQGYAFSAISEERGEVRFGDAPSPYQVVIDPIDGSLNARRTIPSHSLSLAVASGPSMADVDFAYVFDFGAAEEFEAKRHGGARLGGQELRVAQDPGAKLEIVGLEAAEPGWLRPLAASLEGEVYRFRAVGSIAISLAYVAAGRFDGMLAARPCRSVDAAAGQLIVREAGAEVAFGEEDLDAAALGLEVRYPVAAAAHPGGLRTLLDAQAAA